MFVRATLFAYSDDTKHNVDRIKTGKKRLIQAGYKMFMAKVALEQ